ncbi:rnd transporter : Transporter, hydrophobe/amphiphile efflux-1 (HAE1) family OS=Pirellula staleyi (strain ATCC 27377 / DSM 6068 / ICPB 4128) GN=Psta_2288 PE=4 SV=1: ACR_tran [Gemmata massiliana]|uniref:SSD domain-containing protein n=1 Tax=Gemmata massiliana TaxID=1210884 RepID=A0A6P2D9W3_9BACT|nr:multidrug efflux RND transporter permease subunit [Gemmata massiliana]VTR97145.1 rnd transporter : Transporter, hydrophobe/amphiphile efflux-1 (HAE1) family OS=Pirellula staleyi (strain ATCC 27377 / DSM 6068 / ICPB 4128) GN=Psta_2288 PE=4 SV=1: ACR_tran [Gemmata massiliana]
MSGLSKFFIDRPIFAAVISIVIVIAGLVSVRTLPIAQYPEIAPPTVEVRCTYTGASATIVAETVAAPVEQQVVGVERMLYMSSQCTNDGTYVLTVTFEVGTNLDDAQVQVQNRVNLALPTLPEEVKQTGVSVKKKSPNILLVVNLTSPDKSRDLLYLSNYATINIVDELKQVEGVGDVTMFGQLDYSMRVWLDPAKVASRNLTAPDIISALKTQNVQVAAGSLGRPPVPTGQAFQYTLSTQGRLTKPEEFGEIIIRTDPDGATTRLRDVVSDRRTVTDATGTKRNLGGIELGAKSEDTGCTLDGKPSVGVPVYQLPGSNAIETAERIRARMTQLKSDFPAGVDYAIVYDTTPFVEESIAEVFHALRDAIILVAIVVLVFLQSWRATLIPLIAVPVAIVGTFAVMAGIGFSLNNLSLLGLVLAIGIVVDDAIVVVEAVEHKLEHGYAPVDAARRAMDEVASPIMAISLVLMAVFVPCAFISGITGQFFKQFAVTIAVSTFFSALNSLTLSPALCALLLKPKAEQTDPLTRGINLLLGWFFRLFNFGFDRGSAGYARGVGWLLRVSVVVLVVYGGLLFLTYKGFTTVPTGFIPTQDKGYLVVNVQLPDAASLERTAIVTSEIERIARGDENDKENYPGVPGVGHTITIPGTSVIQNANGSNFATLFIVLDEFHNRHKPELRGDAIAGKLRAEFFRRIENASVAVFPPPPVDGLGSAGGFKVMIRDRAAQGLSPLQAATDVVAAKGNETPGLVGLFTPFRSNTPQLFVDVDRTKCLSMGVPLNDVFLTLQVYLGGYYTNDFNQFGRTWQVNLQADPGQRLTPDDVKQLKVRNNDGTMVPLGSVAEVRPVGGPVMVTRYNGVTAAAINGASLPGVSSGQVITSIDQVANDTLPQGMNYQWTELTLLQIRAGNTAILVFALAVVLVYLLLAAQYESLRLPLAVILVVPMCLLCSVVGVAIAKLDINIFVQVGFVVLVGLAAKNAILIVEFAKEKRAEGNTSHAAAVEACRLRLRPILMTSFAFILGVVPLVFAAGAGAEMRRALGISVFSGMLGVTLFGIFLTPVFYHLQEKFASLFGSPVAPGAEPKERSAAPHSNGDGVAADSVATNGPAQAPKT